MAGRPMSVLTRKTVTGLASPAAETNIVYAGPVAAQGGDITGTGGTGNNPVTVIRANLNILTGAGTTALVVTCRQGEATTSGPIVGQQLTVTVAASSYYQLECEWDDDSNWLAQEGGGTYTITIAETGATANGTVNVIVMEVLQ